MVMTPINFQTRNVARFNNPPEGEQRLIRDFFQNKVNGFYVDVGANEPVFNSQTWHLEQLGWDGILIEPLPSYCADLAAQRKGKVVQVACSSPANHGQTLKLLVAGGHSTLNAAPIALGTHSQVYANVLCKTLDSTLEDCQVPLNFDFISVDIEGHEMEMFEGFTLRKWQPKLVLLEDHVTSHDKHNFMLGCGYELILRTGLNSWYVPVQAKFSLSLFAKWQVFRKYWLGLLLRKWRYAR
jgi:FkbM family methyltransferase